jgi:putative hemolysin
MKRGQSERMPPARVQSAPPEGSPKPGAAALSATQGTGLRRWLPGYGRLLALRGQLPADSALGAFTAAALRALDVEVELGSGSLASIPATGAAIFTCNHPFGCLDGLAALAVLGRIRPDLRVLATAELAVVPEIAAALFAVDPRATREARRLNARSVRAAVRWVRGGGALLIFPAGEVARLRLRTLRVSDARWPGTIGSLVRLSGAAVTPLYVEGRNSALFIGASLLCKPLGALLLAQELLNKCGTRLRMHLGTARSAELLARCASDTDLAAYLRLQCELLPRLAAENPRPAEAGPVDAAPAAAPLIASAAPPQLHRAPAELLERELSRLSSDALLVQSGKYRVYALRASAAPALMQEVGRQRECSFRAVGEGTGNDIDCDLYDNLYDQLVLWDTERRAVAGGYRVCRIDEVRRHCGPRALYTQTLFDYQEPFFGLLGPALELGRSFVGTAYQRSHTPLLLLWSAICAYVARHPRHVRLLGPVSISNAYLGVSREVIVDYLRAAFLDPVLSRLVRARTPFRRRHRLQPLDHEALRALDPEGISSLVAEREPDGKGLPVLLRQYLRMGGRILGFNVDPAFANTLDCLLLVDLRHTDPRLLQRYFPANAPVPDRRAAAGDTAARGERLRRYRRAPARLSTNQR